MFARKIGIIGIATAVAAIAVLPTIAQAQNASALFAQRQQIMNQIQACNAANIRSAQIRSAQGLFPQQFPCTNNIPLWTTRVWQYDIAIARANGDRRHACQIEYMQGCENYRN
jgi:type II secretory pathway pseudopilin PulG